MAYQDTTPNFGLKEGKRYVVSLYRDVLSVIVIIKEY